MMNNKGQVTIFVIVALVLVVVVFAIIMLNRGKVSLREQDFDNPEKYIGSCIKDRANIIIEEMLSGGGFPDSNDTVFYNGEQITYLCRNINNFDPCINQYPLYVSQVEKEFNENIEDDAEQCFSMLKQEFIDRNYKLSDSGDVDLKAKFKPGIVEITLDVDFALSKSDVSKKFSKFDTFVPSKIQSIGFVVNEIISQEAKWCYFSNDGFMVLYPEYDIRVYMMEDTTKIYTIKNKKTGETLKMATRGCALPAGLI